MLFEVWNMTTGGEFRNKFETEEKLLITYNAQKIDSVYDMINEKWYFYARIIDEKNCITDVLRYNIL